MQFLRPEETLLVGNWLANGKTVQRDKTAERIEWLVANSLEKIAVSKQWGAWETLYVDPRDGRYWEKVHMQSGMHGGGPPTLKIVSESAARSKYDFKLGETMMNNGDAEL